MRKTILCLVLLYTTLSAFTQQTTTTMPATPLTKEDYLRKSSGQTVGGILLAIAGAGFIVGAASYDMNHLFDASASNTTGFYVAGLGALGGSVAMFLASGRNRRKARAATVAPAVKMDRVAALSPAGLTARSYPALGLTVKL
jgi:predicted lipid-binding transport protein (Tim44 family)